MNQTAAFASVAVTVLISVITLAYHLGKLSNKVEALEIWRSSIRVDMHEVSEITKRLEVGQATVAAQIQEIKKIIDRRDWTSRPK